MTTRPFHSPSPGTRAVWLTALFIFGMWLGGCGGDGVTSAPITAAGNGVAKIVALTDGAERANKAIKPHADDVGKALAEQVTQAHGAIGSEAEKVNTDLHAAQSQVTALTNDKTIALGIISQLRNSGAYRLGTFLFFIGWLLVALCAIHLICLLLALILPPPYSTIASVVGKFCNPFSWPQWFVANIQKNRALDEKNKAIAQQEAAAVAAFQQATNARAALAEVAHDAATFVQPTVPFSIPTQAALLQVAPNSPAAQPVPGQSVVLVAPGAGAA